MFTIFSMVFQFRVVMFFEYCFSNNSMALGVLFLLKSNTEKTLFLYSCITAKDISLDCQGVERLDLISLFNNEIYKRVLLSTSMFLNGFKLYIALISSAVLTITGIEKPNFSAKWISKKVSI